MALENQKKKKDKAVFQLELIKKCTWTFLSFNNHTFPT